MNFRQILNRMRPAMVLCLATANLVFGVSASAQTNGNSATTCSQSGTEVTCTTTTKFTLSAGINLQSGLGGNGNFQILGGGPGCTGLGANPQQVTPNQSTPVTLTVSNCAANSSFSWAAPAQSTNASTSSHNLTLASTSATQAYSVTVCLPGATTAPGCATYTTTVTATGGVQQLTGCSISPTSPINITTSSSTTLTASCATGTGSGSGVTYQWRQNSVNIGGATSSQLSVNGASLAAGNYTYDVIIANTAGTFSPNPSATVSVSSVVGGNLCPAGLSPGQQFTVGSSGSQRWQSSGHPDTTPYYVKITVPSGVKAGGLAGIVANESTPPFDREITVSQTACDFNAAGKIITGGQSAYLNFAFDSAGLASLTPPTPGVSGNYLLTPGVWYVNFRSQSGTCPTSWAPNGCAMNISWAGLR
jgi:hypothetical protein